MNSLSLGAHFQRGTWETRSGLGKGLISSHHQDPQHSQRSKSHSHSNGPLPCLLRRKKTLPCWLLTWSCQDLPFLKTLKSSPPFHTRHLPSHFLINTFIISIIQNFFLYTQLSFIFKTLPPPALPQASLQRFALKRQHRFSLCHLFLPCCPAPPASFPHTLPYLFLCCLLSGPHPPPPLSHVHIHCFIFYSPSVQCSLLYCLSCTCKWPFHGTKTTFSPRCLSYSRSPLITYVSGQHNKMWT